VADKGLGLERRRLRGKSKVKIPVAMQGVLAICKKNPIGVTVA